MKSSYLPQDGWAEDIKWDKPDTERQHAISLCGSRKEKWPEWRNCDYWRLKEGAGCGLKEARVLSACRSHGLKHCISPCLYVQLMHINNKTIIITLTKMNLNMLQKYIYTYICVYTHIHAYIIYITYMYTLIYVYKDI